MCLKKLEKNYYIFNYGIIVRLEYRKQTLWGRNYRKIEENIFFFRKLIKYFHVVRPNVLRFYFTAWKMDNLRIAPSTGVMLPTFLSSKLNKSNFIEFDFSLQIMLNIYKIQ